MITTIDMTAYIKGRLTSYKEQLDNARTLADPQEMLMAESVIEELNHLLTILSIHNKRG